MLAVVDMKVGNLRSVLEGFGRVGAPVRVVECPEDVDGADAIVVPGVGAFGDGIASLERQGLVPVIRQAVIERHKPILGICLGMQLLADESEEHGTHQGLGLLPGRVVRLRPTNKDQRIPNMGWCDVTPTRSSSVLFGSHPPVKTFYFAHSYYLECTHAEDMAATIDYGGAIAAAIERGHVFGVQFHPEKSQEAGLDLLEGFVRHTRERAAV
jgi:glutamine amidotransferase